MSESTEELDGPNKYSSILCLHCDDDKEVKWACQDCSQEFCDICKRKHLITDEDSRNHQILRYGSRRLKRTLHPEVIHHSREESAPNPHVRRQKYFPKISSQVSSFLSKSKFVENNAVQHIRMLPSGQGEAWVKCGALSDEIILHDQHGKAMDRIKFASPIQSFVVTPKGDVIFSMLNSRGIWLSSKNGNIKQISEFEFFPNSLYINNKNELLVCSLSSSRHPIFTLTQHNKKVPVPIDQGINLQQIYNVAQSENGTICVVEKGGWGPGRVVGIDSEGRQKFVYRGQKGAFDPSGITCDSSGFVYVSDCRTNNVHVLKENGEFHSFLLSLDVLAVPEAVQVSDFGTVWVGNGRGEIKVFKLTPQEQSLAL